MPNRSFVNTARTPLALTALVGFACLIGWQHRDLDQGSSAEAIEAATIEAELALGQDGQQLLVDLVEPEDGEGGTEAELEALIHSLGLDVEPAGFYSETEHLWRVRGTPEQLSAVARQLADHPLVEGTEAELTYSLPQGTLVQFDEESDDADIAKPRRPRYTPDDPMYPLQWHFEAINVPEAWMHTRGRGATVAVIDTGVAYKDMRWRDIDAKAVPDLAGIEFVAGKTFVNNSLPDGLDDHAHGTHVTGTVAQATDNGIGVAGVAHKAKIMPLKVLSGSGGGTVADIANSIRYAADEGADVINMSLGGPLPSRVMAKAVKYAHDKGVTVICAAGNEKRSRVSYPAAYEGSVAVAATELRGQAQLLLQLGQEPRRLRTRRRYPQRQEWRRSSRRRAAKHDRDPGSLAQWLHVVPGHLDGLAPRCWRCRVDRLSGCDQSPGGRADHEGDRRPPERQGVGQGVRRRDYRRRSGRDRGALRLLG